MNWDKLLCEERLGGNDFGGDCEIRNPFEKDYDRIIFCSAFRRLRDKTQVHLKGGDFVRTRLSHSLEVSSVARSLGYGLGMRIGMRIEREALSDVLSAAALAHDIGHPPYGHVGEKKIQEFFTKLFNKNCHLSEQEFFTELFNKNCSLSEEEKKDFTHFDSNATTFSTVTRNQNWRKKGGLRLTYATLATLCKYPHTSAHADKKKFSFFLEDKEIFNEIAEKVGLIQHSENKWCRHPLAYLLEAADDICYILVDFEDAKYPERDLKIKIKILKDCLEETPNLPDQDQDKIPVLRGEIIGKLIHETLDQFCKQYDDVMQGKKIDNLVDQLEKKDDLLGKGLKKLKESNDKTYKQSNEKIEEEANHNIGKYLKSKLHGKNGKIDYHSALEELEYLVGCTESHLSEITK